MSASVSFVARVDTMYETAGHRRSKDVNMDKLMKEHNFLVEYSPSEMYFGEMVTNINQSGNIKNGIGILLTKTSCY